MRAMILAAGRGNRMGSLTDHLPKPLLKVAGKYLIEHAIYSLTKIGVRDIVINTSYHGHQIKNALGNGLRYGATFHFSEEKEALETGGGIVKALPLLGEQPFIVLSADVISDYPLQNLLNKPTLLAHLVLVDNPVFHPKGDFCLTDSLIHVGKENAFTYSNIGIYKPAFFAQCHPGKFSLGSLLKEAAMNSEVTGEYYRGLWYNIGTPQDLETASNQFS